MIYVSLDFIYRDCGFLPFFESLYAAGRTKEKDDAGSKDEAFEVAGGTGHCMLVTLKFHPRTTFPKSAAGKRENGREE